MNAIAYQQSFALVRELTRFHQPRQGFQYSPSELNELSALWQEARRACEASGTTIDARRQQIKSRGGA